MTARVVEGGGRADQNRGGGIFGWRRAVWEVDHAQEGEVTRYST